MDIGDAAVIEEYDDEEPLAVWEALLLPGWQWEAYEKEEEENRYFGRVKSPNTYGRWEYGYFNREQLKTAGAYRVDTSIEDDEEVPKNIVQRFTSPCSSFELR